MRRASFVVFALWAAHGLSAQTSSSSLVPAPPMVVVSGEADTSIAADRATLEVAVQTHAPTADQAGRDNARIQRAVVGALRRAGVDSARITTTEYTVSMNMVPNGRDKPMKQDGYIANNRIGVEVHRLDQIGAYIDAALGAGATHIDDVSFTSTAEREARRAVLAQAVTNARGEAEAMARAASGTLGRLVEVSTERPGQVSPFRLAAVVVTNAQGTDVSPHPINVSATVYVRWEFVPKP